MEAPEILRGKEGPFSGIPRYSIVSRSCKRIKVQIWHLFSIPNLPPRTRKIPEIPTNRHIFHCDHAARVGPRGLPVDLRQPRVAFRRIPDIGEILRLVAGRFRRYAGGFGGFGGKGRRVL
mgnify:CR=1 FL=1